MIATKLCVFRFGSDVTDGNGTMGDLLGGKGAGLAEMTLLELPVPPGFTITTDTCRHYFQHGRLPAELKDELAVAGNKCRQRHGRRKQSDAGKRSLRCARFHARHDGHGAEPWTQRQDRACLALTSGSEIFALDSYRRLIEMFGSVVLHVPKEAFELAK